MSLGLDGRRINKDCPGRIGGVYPITSRTGTLGRTSTRWMENSGCRLKEALEGQRRNLLF